MLGLGLLFSVVGFLGYGKCLSTISTVRVSVI